MIGLLPVKVPMTTKEQITLSRSGERAKTSGHFYGRLRAVQGIRGLSYTGGYGRFRGEWVNCETVQGFSKFQSHFLLT